LALPVTNTPIATIDLAIPLPSMTPTPNGFVTQIIESGSFAMIGAICLVILVWAALAAGIFIYIYKRASSL
jgi:hypothetical protein